MATMKPEKDIRFQNQSEEDSYELLKHLDDSYMVIYEPSIGKQKRRTPDFVLLSEKYGLIVLDVKHINLDNIRESNQDTITKTSGIRLKNFYKIVKDYAYMVNNHLSSAFRGDSSIVHPNNHKFSGKLTFPHSSGLMLSVEDAQNYTKSDVAKFLSLNESDFIIINNIKNSSQELEQFVKNLNRPFTRGLTQEMKMEILKNIYIDSDASSTEFIRTMSKFNVEFEKSFKDTLSGSHFDKSKQLVNNLIAYTGFSQNSIEVADKNLALGCENIIEKLKGYKAELEENKFTVAVFGYFSTGKSTFLNALMGTDKLPMDEDRSTATFTKLRHCDKSQEYDNGDMQVIYKEKIDIKIVYKQSIDTLISDDEQKKKYIEFDNLESFKDELEKELKDIKIRNYPSEQRDKIKNAKKSLTYILENDIPYGVSEKVPKEEINIFLTDDKKAFGISEVIYYLDNDLLKDIEIVDTPGYGSENTMDTFKTQEFVKEANALILLTEARDPMSKEGEQKFLETYAGIYEDKDGYVNTDNLFVVANKVDVSTKTVEKIKESIKKKIEDNWEDSLRLKDDSIFTMSAKYHHDGNETIESENIHKDDLKNFANHYSKFLTKNRDKEFLKNSFQNIDETIKELHNIFNKTVDEKNKDINDIKSKKEKFKINKDEISQTLNLYIKAISHIETELTTDIKKQLDTQKINEIDKTDLAFERHLNNKELKKDKANKEHAKDFYVKLSTAIYNKIQKENKRSFEEKLKDSMKTINKQIAKYSKALEIEYGVSGLEKKIVTKSIQQKSIGKIEFEKGFFSSILDVFMFGFFVTTKDYAKQMVESWKDTTYNELYTTLNSANNESVNSILDELNIQSEDIVKSIEAKLNDLEKNLNKKEKDRDDYNKKIDKMKSTFKKIDEIKEKIEKQKNSLYGA